MLSFYNSHLSPFSARLLIFICFTLLVATCCSAGGQARTGADRKLLCPDANALLEASAKIDRRGAFRNTVNYNLNRKVLGLADCYSRTGEAFAAEVVTRVLLRYADVIGDWPLIGLDGKVPVDVDFTRWDLGGLWGGEWVYLDLKRSANLARAFELVANSTAVDDVGRRLGLDARNTIREKLLRYLVDFNLRFGRGGRLGTNTQEASFPFSNMDPERLKPLLVFGRVVDPAYIHIAVRLLRLFPTVGFFRDGFWHEGTVTYHRQVAVRLVNLAKDLEGYSDPPGYEHTGYTTLFGDHYQGVLGRFDNLEPLGEVAQNFERLKTADHALTLPDGRMVAKNDTHHTEKGNPSNVPSKSTCLFALRHCVLVGTQGKGKTLVHIDYGGTEGHEHYDALHLDFWASGLVLSDGSYKGFSPWKWNSSTAAHNTVVIDQLNQDSRFVDRATLTLDDRIYGLGHHLMQGYGQGDSENGGNLLAGDLSGSSVQYVAADATPAYNSKVQPRLKNYDRTLILVKAQDSGSYLVDVFNVNGGRQHQWMLHGDLASDAAIKTNLAEQPRKGQLSPYLNIERFAKANGAWSSDLEYPDGRRRLRIYHLGSGESNVVVARAPAQVRKGTANYLSVGRPGPRNTFIAVYFPQGEDSLVKKVTRLPSKLEGDVCVRMRIEFSNGRSDEVAIANKQVGGECGTNGSRITHLATASDGRCLWHYGGDVKTPTSSWRQGTIEVFSQQTGSTKNGFRIATWPVSDDSLAPTLLHIKLPNGSVESYVIRKAERFADQSAFIEVEGEPGLKIVNMRSLGTPFTSVKQLYYPSRGLTGPIMYRTTTNAMQRCDGKHAQQ